MIQRYDVDGYDAYVIEHGDGDYVKYSDYQKEVQTCAKILKDPNCIKRLEDWKQGHKNRSVEIGIDDGYGATCWTVTLNAGKKKVVASEVSFWECDAPLPEHIVFVRSEDDESDWPGLEATINAAIDRAEKLGL